MVPVRLRKQQRPSDAPGDTFLKAVSSGRPAARSGVAPATTDPALRQQLLDTERRAVSAEEALAQIRDESSQRLKEAREALAAERTARLAAEEALERAQAAADTRRDAPAPAREPREAPAQQAPEPEPEPRDPDAGHPGHPDGPPLRDTVHHAEGDEEGEWPTPWLEPDKRGLFGR